jgi:hypothetical protein
VCLFFFRPDFRTRKGAAPSGLARKPFRGLRAVIGVQFDAERTKSKGKQFLKFDAEGNKKVVEALKASEKKDHLRVDVSGEAQGDTLKVTSIKLL